MTTITWKNLKTGKKQIKIYKSKDKLDSTLKSCIRRNNKDTNKVELYLATYQGKKIVEESILYAVTYEEEDEKAIFQKHGIIPKEDDY